MAIGSMRDFPNGLGSRREASERFQLGQEIEIDLDKLNGDANESTHASPTLVGFSFWRA